MVVLLCPLRRFSLLKICLRFVSADLPTSLTPFFFPVKFIDFLFFFFLSTPLLFSTLLSVLSLHGHDHLCSDSRSSHAQQGDHRQSKPAAPRLCISNTCTSDCKKSQCRLHHAAILVSAEVATKPKMRELLPFFFVHPAIFHFNIFVTNDLNLCLHKLLQRLYLWRQIHRL